jgi:hypothetical protein
MPLSILGSTESKISKVFPCSLRPVCCSIPAKNYACVGNAMNSPNNAEEVILEFALRIRGEMPPLYWHGEQLLRAHEKAAQCMESPRPAPGAAF